MLDHVFLENTLLKWGVAATAFAACLLGGLGLRALIRRRYQQSLATERIEVVELPLQVASKTSSLFLVGLALFAGQSILDLAPRPARLVAIAMTGVVFWQIGVWASAIVMAWIEARRRHAAEADRAASGSLGILGFVLRAVTWTLVLLLALDNWGVNITALVAGLGVGGIAIALAVQNILGDLFASLSITLDRPFVVGDFVVVGDHKGTVESIGVKSTRLRSIDGEQIVLANADLLSSRLRNYGRMSERRVLATLGVAYETPRAKLKAIPDAVRKIVEATEGARFDRCHFSKFGDFALEIELVYYVLSPQYTRFMDIQQAVNFAVYEAFEVAGLEFAYPTQKLWLARVAPNGEPGNVPQARPDDAPSRAPEVSRSS